MSSKILKSSKKANKMTAQELKDIFVLNKKTLGSIESFTGGLFASTVTKISGASGYFKGSIVTYWTEEKERLLGISPLDVNKYGVVSKEIAEQMAVYGRDLLDVDICVSFTGNAGPTAMEDKPVGEIYIGIADEEGVNVYPYQLNGSREEIQNKAVQLAIEKLLNK